MKFEHWVWVYDNIKRKDFKNFYVKAMKSVKEPIGIFRYEGEFKCFKLF